MAKFAALLVAAFAFQAVLAGPFDWDQQNSNLRTLKKRYQEVSHQAIEAIDNVHVQEHESARTLAVQANEYAHDLHKAVYHLYQIVHHVEGNHVQELLDQVAHVLSDYAHAVHQAVTSEPFQLKGVLKQNILGVNYQIERLAQVCQQLQQQAEHGEGNVAHKIEKVVEELLDAIHEFKFRGQVQHESHHETSTSIQDYAHEVSSVIQRITTSNEYVSHELAHQAHELSHLVGHIVHHLLRELHSQGVDHESVFQQIIQHLGEIRVHLEQLVKSHGGSVQSRIEELKTQLRTYVHNFADQIERLVQVGQQSHHDVNSLVKYVVSDVLTGYQHLQRNLEQLTRSQYHHEQY